MRIIRDLFSHWFQTLQTFPLSHSVLLVLTVCVCIQIGDFGWVEVFFGRILLTGCFIFLLSLYGPLLKLHFDTRISYKNYWNWGLQLCAVLAGILFWRQIAGFEFFEIPYEFLWILGIFLLFGVGIFLFLALAHFQKEVKSWLSYVFCFQSLIFGVVAGGILFAGVAGTFFSIETLFDVEISYKAYSYLGAVCMIFLAGAFMLNYYFISVKQSLLDQKSEFVLYSSRVERVFGMYIFLPLMLVYLLIFLAYGVKIVWTGQWPSGVLVWLGAGYILGGFLTYALTYPEQGKKYELLRTLIFSSFFLILSLMGAAIWQRIAQYGLTFDRYFVVVGILAVGFSSMLMLAFPKKRILNFFLVMFVMIGVSFFGPFNASKVTLSTQIARLDAVLSQNNLQLPLGSGSLSSLTGHDAGRVHQVLEYLTDVYPFEVLRDKIVDDGFESGERWLLMSDLREYTGLSRGYYDYLDHESGKNSEYFSFNASLNGLDLRGYQKLFFLEDFVLDSSSESEFLYRYQFGGATGTVDLAPYWSEIFERSGKRQEAPFEIELEDRKIILLDLTGERSFEEPYQLLDIYYANGYILLK